MGVDYLSIHKAYPQSDIIWPNLKVSAIVAIFKQSLLFLSLCLLSLLFLTPAYAISLLDPLRLTVERWFQSNEFLVEFVGEYFGPMIILTMNFVLIPALIDALSEFEGFRRKSSRQIGIMRRLFFFMLMNTLIIPVTQTSTALIFFRKLEEKSIGSWPSMLSSNLMAQQYFYIKFIIQLTFISNGIWLIDLSHRTIVFVKARYHNYKYKDSIEKPLFVDDYAFDLGYHQSYALVIFLNCLLFSCTVPLISFFAALFFWVKYLVDKYNLIFVYFEVYESGGQIRKNVAGYMVFNLFLYLTVTVSFFALKFSSAYFWGGTGMIIVWVCICYKTWKALMEAYRLDGYLQKDRDT